MARVQWWAPGLATVVAATGWAGPSPQEEAKVTDLVARRELRRARLDGEFDLLKDVRHDLFDAYMVTEGTRITLSLPLVFRFDEQDVPGLRARRLVSRLAPPTPRGMAVVQDDARLDLPRAHLALGEEDGPFLFDIGAIEGSVGSGALVSDYATASGEGTGLSSPGLHLRGRTRGLGVTLFTSDVSRPGRVSAFSVSGRPLAWIWGSASNLKPEGSAELEDEGLLFNLVNVAITGAVDNQAPGMASGLTGSPGTAGGASLEADLGFDHELLGLKGFANATVLGRRQARQTQLGDLWGAGGRAGLRGKLDVKLLQLGATAGLDLASADYLPSYFDRDYEADRVAGPTWSPKLALRTPARVGYNLAAHAQLLKSLGAFVELSDMAPLGGARGHDIDLRVGGLWRILGFFSVMGAYVNRGAESYDKVFAPTRSATWLAEQRLSLFVFTLVARQWRSFEPVDGGRTLARDGQSLLGQVQLGI